MNERTEILLKEYELCQESGYQNETHTWQTGTVFLGLSLAGLSILGQLGAQTWDRFLLTAAVAGTSITALYLWKGIVDRWRQMMDVRWYRMREIEAELGGMYRARYPEWLDHGPGSEPLSDEDKRHWDSLQMRFSGWRGHTIRHYASYLVYALMSGWVLIVVIQFLNLISHKP